MSNTIDFTKEGISRKALKQTSSRQLSRLKPHLIDVYQEMEGLEIIHYLKTMCGLSDTGDSTDLESDDCKFLFEVLYAYLNLTEIAEAKKQSEESRLSLATQKAEDLGEDEPLEVVFK